MYKTVEWWVRSNAPTTVCGSRWAEPHTARHKHDRASGQSAWQTNTRRQGQQRGRLSGHCLLQVLLEWPTPGVTHGCSTAVSVSRAGTSNAFTSVVGQYKTTVSRRIVFSLVRQYAKHEKAEGVFRAREIRRLEPQSRWDKEIINSVIGMLWRLTDDRWTVDSPPLPFRSRLGNNHKAGRR